MDEKEQLEKKSESIDSAKTLEEQFAILSKKVDEQFKFTRYVVVLCTLVTIGLMIFTVLMTFESLPTQITLHFMSNLEPIVVQWRSIEMIQKAKDEARVRSQAAPQATPETETVPAAK